jgi:hypothetical protein
MENDFRDQLPHSKMRTKIESNGSSITADVAYDENGKINIELLKQHSNPKHYDKIMEGGTIIYTGSQPLFGNNPIPPGFKEIESIINVRRAEITLLKIAYLRAFEIFGYGMLVHPFMPIVREQILNPDKVILPNILSIATKVSKEMIGINFMRNPEELKCFLIVFEVHTKSNRRIFAVPLPGWSKPGIDIYFPDIHKQFTEENGTTINCDFTQFYGFDYVAEKDAAFMAMDIWYNFEKNMKNKASH